MSGVDAALLRKRGKAALAQGAAYQGYLTQFKQNYELRYETGAALPKVPKQVTNKRKELGWTDHKVEYLCQGKCTIVQLGIDEAVVLVLDVMGGQAARVLIMSLDKPEMGVTVAHVDVRREELTAGDESWWLGQDPAIRATRVASTSEMKGKLAAQRLGLADGAVYCGKCSHPFFKPYDVTYEFGKVLPAPPDEAVAARKALGWTLDAEACCKGLQSIPEFGAKQSEVVIMADMFGEERRLLIIPIEKPDLGISVACLSEDGKQLCGGEGEWWTSQEPMFVTDRIK